MTIFISNFAENLKQCCASGVFMHIPTTTGWWIAKREANNFVFGKKLKDSFIRAPRYFVPRLTVCAIVVILDLS